LNPATEQHKQMKSLSSFQLA